jgi:hypothetical protein
MKQLCGGEVVLQQLEERKNQKEDLQNKAGGQV